MTLDEKLELLGRIVMLPLSQREVISSLSEEMMPVYLHHFERINAGARIVDSLIELCAEAEKTAIQAYAETDAVKFAVRH